MNEEEDSELSILVHKLFDPLRSRAIEATHGFADRILNAINELPKSRGTRSGWGAAINVLTESINVMTALAGRKPDPDKEDDNGKTSD